MDSYISTQQGTIFQHVAVLIYVFEVDSAAGIASPNVEKDNEREHDVSYYRACLASLKRHSPTAKIFVLIHKMDLVRKNRPEVFERRVKELEEESGPDANVTAFGTSIWDESLYKVRSLVQNARLAKHKTGMVSHRPHPHPQCCSTFEASHNVRGGLWRDRGYYLRSDNIPGYSDERVIFSYVLRAARGHSRRRRRGPRVSAGRKICDGTGISQ